MKNEKIKSHPPLSWKMERKCIGICDGMKTMLHSKSILHLDLKPENVLHNPDDERYQIYERFSLDLRTVTHFCNSLLFFYFGAALNTNFYSLCLATTVDNLVTSLATAQPARTAAEEAVEVVAVEEVAAAADALATAAARLVTSRVTALRVVVEVATAEETAVETSVATPVAEPATDVARLVTSRVTALRVVVVVATAEETSAHSRRPATDAARLVTSRVTAQPVVVVVATVEETSAHSRRPATDAARLVTSRVTALRVVATAAETAAAEISVATPVVALATDAARLATSRVTALRVVEVVEVVETSVVTPVVTLLAALATTADRPVTSRVTAHRKSPARVPATIAVSRVTCPVTAPISRHSRARVVPTTTKVVGSFLLLK